MTPDARDGFARRRLTGLLLRGPVPTPAAVVSRLIAMQSQEDRFARWSVAQRTTQPDPVSVDAALNSGAILRTHVLRPTWHYVAPDDLRWLLTLSGPIVDGGNTRRYRELGLDSAALGRANDVFAQSVSEGTKTRHELAEALEMHGISTEGQRLAHLLLHAELTMVLCSGPRRGLHHTYAAFDQRVPQGRGPQGDEALAELAWRYFSTRGPATVADFAWWSGLPAAPARRAHAFAGSRLAGEVRDGREYWWADAGPESPGDPTAAAVATAAAGPKAAAVAAAQEERVDLVQCFDEIVISYRQTRDVLHTDTASFPVPGPIDGFSHVSLLDGRLLGHWRAPTRSGRRQVEARVPETVALDDAVEEALGRAMNRCQEFFGRQDTLLAGRGGER